MSNQNKLKREQAEARNAERANRSAKDQIAKLDAMLGVGQGAKKERARLAAPTPVPETAKPTPVT